VAFSVGGDGGRSQQPSKPVRGDQPPELYGINRERRKKPRSRQRVAFHATLVTALASKGWRIAPTCTCVHTPPRAVRTLRSLSLAAIAL
jgi:hypothetical protein